MFTKTFKIFKVSGGIMVTLKDVAKKCNVSLATVSKALNGHTDIGEQTADSIRQIAKEMGYLPNAMARALKTNRSNNIGVLFVDKTSSGLTHEYFSEILNSLKVHAEFRGYDITFISSNIGSFSMDYYEHAKYRRCDGVVIASVDFDNPDVIKLVNSEIPTVTLDYIFNNCFAVMSDNITSMQEIVSHVYSLGHNKIAYIHGEDTSVTQKRIASFYKTCKSFGINVPDEYVKSAMYHDPRSSGLATRELLALEDRPTCILYPDDFSFIGGMNEIEKQGLSIPEDISVVGYDGILLSQVLRPKLTTFRQDAEEIGKQAALALIDKIENPKQFITNHVVVKGKLIPGDTVKRI